jgi:hypothetical protein
MEANDERPASVRTHTSPSNAFRNALKRVLNASEPLTKTGPIVIQAVRIFESLSASSSFPRSRTLDATLHITEFPRAEVPQSKFSFNPHESNLPSEELSERLEQQLVYDKIISPLSPSPIVLNLEIRSLQRQLEELVERHQQLMEEKELLNERRDQQNLRLDLLVESHKRLVQKLTDEYEYKLLVLKEQLAQEHLTLQCIQNEKDKLMCELEETRKRVRPVQTLASVDKSLQVDNGTTENKRRMAELLKKSKDSEAAMIAKGAEIEALTRLEAATKELELTVSEIKGHELQREVEVEADIRCCLSLLAQNLVPSTDTSAVDAKRCCLSSIAGLEGLPRRVCELEVMDKSLMEADMSVETSRQHEKEIRELSSNEDKVSEERSEMRSGPRLEASKGESEAAYTAATSALPPKDAQADQLKRRLDLSREIYAVCARGQASITAKTSSNTSGDCEEMDYLKKELSAGVIYSVTHARAFPEEAKNAELENLRKQHEMLSSRSASSGKFMHASSNNLAEEAECDTKILEDELDAARQKAVDLLSQLQESRHACSSTDKDKERLEQEIAALIKAFESETERAQKAVKVQTHADRQDGVPTCSEMERQAALAATVALIDFDLRYFVWKSACVKSQQLLFPDVDLECVSRSA